ncbi:polyphosphate kinase 1 [Candidatus Sumerlaeota bacterium]|nr:polyphosphate kinase 1 [Candidatus Sumerlaeota bacterium]
MAKAQHDQFFNRELSWLAFNNRVLHEALDERTPLLERLKFVSIVESNLDEFFMKRVGGLKRQLSAGVRSPSLDGRSPSEQLAEIRRLVIEMVGRQQSCLIEELLPRLGAEGYRFLDHGSLSHRDVAHVRDFFTRHLPVFTPLGVDPGHPFPNLSNLSLSLAVRLIVRGNGEQYARVKIPSNLPRWVPLTKPNQWVPLEQVVAHNLEQLFPGTEILEACPFRITRNADLERNEEEAEDLLELIAEELRGRRVAPVVRVEVARVMSQRLREWLCESLEVKEEDVYEIPGLLNVGDLMSMTELEIPHLQWPPQIAVTHPRLRALDEPDSDRNFFQIIREGDILVHHPYHSFATSVLRFLEMAAEDPKVLAIKQTLYRTAKRSPIIKALVRAAENGKQVVVLVEIKARFDEANNIEWVKILENAGAHVAYGLVGLKTHNKTILVVRQEEIGLRSYCHIGTGNYHTGTARLYTDLGLFTCEETTCAELVHLFNFLTGHSRYRAYRRLLVAPFNMRARFLEMIDREIEKHTPEEPGRIIAKMNQVEDREIMLRLHRASKAGVQIDLIIRGFCCLRPGLPGVTENIRVMSAIGRFLEHTRIFYFRNGGEEEYYIGSADWMYRNLDRRVEATTPVSDPTLQAQLRDILDAHLRDRRQTWDLQPDGTYVQRSPEEPEDEGVQAKLMQSLVTG